MAIVRRLYLYAIAGVTLAMLVGALITLINLALQIAFGRSDSLYGSPDTFARDQLSTALATIAVALPVWAFHWAIAERSLRSQTGDAERGSAVRALYLTVVLLALLGVLLASGTQIVAYILAMLLGGAQPSTIEVLSPIGAVLVAGAFWAYHVWVRLRDLRTEMSRAAAWLPRVYLYLAMLIGLFTMLYGIVQLIGLAGDALGLNSEGVLSGTVARPLSLVGVFQSIVVGFVLWFTHWAYGVRLLEAPDWRGPAERASRTRAGYFVIVILVGAGFFLFELSSALATVLGAMLSTNATLQLNDAAAVDPVRSAVGSIVIAIVFAGVWWAHRLALIGERSASGPSAQLSARRVDAYAVMALALSAGASGLAWLVGLALDVVGRGGRTLSGATSWKLELATFLAYAIVAGILWLLELRQVQRWRTADQQAEVHSTARRAYLLLAIAGGVLGALSALVLILNRLIGSLIGADVSSSLAPELSAPAGVVIVAVLVVMLHFWWLRRDERAPAMPTETAPAPSPGLPAPQAVAPERVQLLTLSVPPDADMAQALSNLRATLPDGYRLDEAD